MKSMQLRFLILCSLILGNALHSPAQKPHVRISGIYPHLAAFNQPEDPADRGRHQEAGIGAVVPWAGSLWFLTYPPHQRKGSNDKLYQVSPGMELSIRPESVGGTHASRMIHRPSNQLFIGPYAINAQGGVRAIDVTQLEGRMTATMAHLGDPYNKVYYYDMEGAIYEVDVYTLEVTRLFEKPFPGWHGKGAYTAQGKVVFANNGEHRPGSTEGYEKLLVGGPSEHEEEGGALAAWDGQRFQLIERRPYTEVTGPGGIEGNGDPKGVLWATGWDKRSVMLQLLDQGEWYKFRLPKGSHTFDPIHGWYTEWPRIRAIEGHERLMVMHGTLFHFPDSFSIAQTGGIYPLSTHLRYIPDLCSWQGQVVLAADDASAMQNPLVGQPQSNLWFGPYEALQHFGPRSGWGGMYIGDKVGAGQLSDPFLIAGYAQRTLHLVNHGPRAVYISLEVDESGDRRWTPWQGFSLPAGAYRAEILPPDLQATWIRILNRESTQLSAYMHLYSPREPIDGEGSLFEGLAGLEEGSYHTGIIRPAGHNRNLQWLMKAVQEGQGAPAAYREWTLNEAERALELLSPTDNREQELLERAGLPDVPPFEVDAASVIIRGPEGRAYRLPKGPEAFDHPFPEGWPRAIREAVSERYLANIHGTFYEIPRSPGAGNHLPDIQKIKPIASHQKRIQDFCTWRGLLVLTGVADQAQAGEHIRTGPQGEKVWMGMIDDLWRLGKPIGQGGPWKNTPVAANTYSDPYLMTGYDQKTLSLSHEGTATVTFTLEWAINHEEWAVYNSWEVAPGEKLVVNLPEGLHAHWARLKTDRACTATAFFIYR